MANMGMIFDTHFHLKKKEKSLTEINGFSKYTMHKSRNVLIQQFSVFFTANLINTLKTSLLKLGLLVMLFFKMNQLENSTPPKQKFLV